MRLIFDRDAKLPTRPLRWALIAWAATMLVACSSLPSASTRDELADESGGSCAPSGVPHSAPASPTPTPSAATSATSIAPVKARSSQSALPHLDLQGQLSIKLSAFGDQPAKGLSLGFFFTGNTDTGQLDLITLMGSQMAQVNWAPGAAWLSDDKGKHPYASLDALSVAALGEALPLRAMVYWMQGKADPDAHTVPGPEPDTFIQSGWTIDTRQLSAKKLLAQRSGTATQRGAQIKIYLDR